MPSCHAPFLPCRDRSEKLQQNHDPSDLEDRYETRLRAMIDAKLKGEGMDVEDTEAPVDRGNVIDLMAALKKSLGQAPSEESAPKSAAAPKAKARTKEPIRNQPGLKLPIKGGKMTADKPAVVESPTAATKPSRKRA
jgi:DNA end-binding protein Ku